MGIGILYAVMFWIATLVLVIGVANKIYIYTKVPAPLKIPIMPAAVSQGGVIVRMLQEVFLFKSLYRADKLLWLLGWLFHYSLLFMVVWHFRFVIDSIGPFFIFIYPMGKYVGIILVLSLTGLLLRRILIDRIKYITSPSDIAMLLLLISIACSGWFMSNISYTNVVMVKSFFVGLINFDWQPLPADFVLLLHLGLVALLMLIFPISKLIHAPGLFFSPTRNQVDNARDKRHLAPWAAKLEQREKTNSDESH